MTDSLRDELEKLRDELASTGRGPYKWIADRITAILAKRQPSEPGPCSCAEKMREACAAIFNDEALLKGFTARMAILKVPLPECDCVRAATDERMARGAEAKRQPSEPTDDELSQGTFACPICGRDYPHSEDVHRVSEPIIPSDGLCPVRFIYDGIRHICSLKFGHEGKHDFVFWTLDRKL